MMAYRDISDCPILSLLLKYDLFIAKVKNIRVFSVCLSQVVSNNCLQGRAISYDSIGTNNINILNCLYNYTLFVPGHACLTGASTTSVLLL